MTGVQTCALPIFHPTGRNEEPQDLPALDTARIVGNLANGITRSLEQIVKAVVEANR